MPLLLCNLELLLPIRTNGTSSELQSKPAPREVQLETKAINSNSVRNKHKLSRKKYIESSNLSTKPQRTSLSLKVTPLRTSSSVGKPDKAAKVASDCLNALTDFFDLMSYVDATVPPAEPLVSGPCTRDEFVWTGAAIKDSLLDEMREEEGGSSGQERLLEIQAAVEGLGCHSCWNRVSEAWTEAQRCRQGLGDAKWRRLMETLTVSVSSNRKSPSFSCQPLCAPRWVYLHFRAVLPVSVSVWSCCYCSSWLAKIRQHRGLKLSVILLWPVLKNSSALWSYIF